MSKKKYSKEDASLETLLDLDGEVFPMDNGYWTKFEACRVEPTKQIPHIIETTLGFWGSTMLTLTNLRESNMEHAKLPGITNIK